MERFSRIFRVFVSSTFSDLKSERNILQELVFPKLQDMAESKGCTFQAMDLRWGVSDEAALDQQTMKICLAEIARCQKVTPRPNFIILLGDRYGWCPLPYEIPNEEFEAILPHLDEAEKAHVIEWYRRDDNAIPAAWMLQPRLGRYIDQAIWETVEQPIHTALEKAAAAARLPEAALFKYSASATEQEILHGLLKVPDATSHVFCYARRQRSTGEDAGSPSYKLEALKRRLSALLGSHFHEYAISNGPDNSPTALEQLCSDVHHDLEQIIRKEIERIEFVEPQTLEITAHADFGATRRRGFCGREKLLQQIHAFLRGAADGKKKRKEQVLIIAGESGSGKSALMAEAALEAETTHPGSQCIVRYIGATPASTNRCSLLGSLCMEIQDRYARPAWLPSDPPVEYRALVEEFTLRLYLAMASPEKPLFLFVDALDLLGGSDMDWVPDKLPEHVYLVLSITPGKSLELLRARLPKNPITTIEALAFQEGMQLMEQTLQEHHRQIQPEQQQLLTTRLQENGLPLYEKLLLEQACTWQSYQDQKKLRPGTDIPGAIHALLDELSEESRHGEVLVRRALAYLQAARNGLSENELLGVLSSDLELYEWFLIGQHHAPPDLLHALIQVREEDGKCCNAEQAQAWLDDQKRNPGAVHQLLIRLRAQHRLRLPVVLWSRLYADLEPYLIKKFADGISVFSFFHQQFARVIEDRYLSGEDAVDFHRALGEHYSAQPVYLKQGDRSMPNQRKLSEQLYHQVRAKQWKEAEAALTDFDFLRAQIEGGNLQPFLADLNLLFATGGASKFLRLLQSALRASMHTLENDLTQLPAQLTGRMMLDPSPETIHFLESMKNQPRRWLRPMEANLTPAGTAMLQNLYGHDKGVVAVTWSPDGQRIVSGSTDKTARIWDAGSGAPLAVLEGHNDPVDDGWVTPDGRRVVTASFDLGGQLIAWDMATGLQISAFGHEGMVIGVGFSADSQQVISLCSEGYVKTWEIENGEECGSSREESGFSNAVTTPDHRLALAMTGRETLQIWDLQQGICIAELPGPAGEEPILAISAGGTVGMAAGDQDSLIVVDIPTGRQLFRLDSPANTALALTPDGSLALAGTRAGQIQTWDLKTQQACFTLVGHTGEIREILVTPDGKRAISRAAKDKLIRMWDLEAGSALPVFPGHSAEINSLALEPKKGERLVSASSDKSIKIWDVNSGSQLELPDQQLGGIADMAISRATSGLATISKDGGLRLWNPGGGPAWKVLDVKAKTPPCCVAVNGSGEIAAVGYLDGGLAVWDVARKEQSMSIPGGYGYVRGIAMTYDGGRLLAVYSHGQLIAWDAKNGQLLLSIQAYEPVQQSVVSGWRVAIPDTARWAVTCSLSYPGIRLWNMETGEKQASYGNHKASVTSVAITRSGHFACSGSKDKSIRVYDLVKGRLQAEFAGHTEPIEEVAMDEDGSLVVSAGADRTLRAWNWQSGKQVACFTGESEFTGCALSDRNIAASDSGGRLHFFRLER